MAALFIDMHADQPLMLITKIRSLRGKSQATLTLVHRLRTQISRARQLLEGSRCGFAEELDRLTAALDPHVRSGPEAYTLHDLIRIALQGRNCNLFEQLSPIVPVVAEHVHGCEACRRSGRFCPICASSVPIFAFEVDQFHLCGGCQTAYHKRCFSRANSQCPVCASLSGRAAGAPGAAGGT